MPSPYATHRPTTTRASVSNERRASRARRDLPIPGGPTTVASAHDDSRTAVSKASRSSPSSPAATDEERRDRPREGRHVRAEAEQPPGDEWPALALRLDLAGRLRRNRLPDEVVGRLAEEHLARLCGLLEARSHIHGVAGRQLLVGHGLTDDHLARVHAGPRRDADPVLASELLVESLERLTHLERRPHRAKRVVLVDGRHSEHRHDRIADELLDGAAVPFERRLHGIEVPPHHTPKRLGVEPLAERGRAGDVREDDRDDLARLRGARSPVERGAACAAEARVRVVLAPAGAADHATDPTPGDADRHVAGRRSR